MCLGIPGKIIEIFHEHDVLMGKIDFGGIRKNVCLNLTPEAEIDQYVIVHVGFALQVIDEAEADQIFRFLESIDELGELDEPDELANTTDATDVISEAERLG